MPGFVRLVMTIVGLSGLTAVPSQVKTVTHHSSRIGSVRMVAP
jgi:hypothetical protein